ncbi:putative cytochrome P450 [Lyophyllum shimeji]|uniref:Cytochrome P450 n=1 Tax=Lyophyllum shimeji TaxID=47721 RepID=A0A9P3PSP8_LYOSH|nr:putative cytochrome P450 [Lyophyllum shimeji]
MAGYRDWISIACFGTIFHQRYRKHEPTLTRFLWETVLVCGAATIPSMSRAAGLTLVDAFRTFCLVTLGYVSSLCISVIIYRHSPLHPLARFPGPAVAISTKWWMVHRILIKGGRHTKLQTLHAAHGPWVRVGPNELSVNLPGAIKVIYGQLDRGPFYQGTPANADTLITVVDRKIHVRRRQAWTKAVTGDAMRSFIPLVEGRVDQLMNIFRSRASQNLPTDIDHWINLFFMDTMGDMGFSGGFETMVSGRDTEDWLKTLSAGVIFVSCMGQVPWLRDLFRFLPKSGPIQSFQAFTQAKVDEIQKTTTRRKDILGIIMNDTSPSLTSDEAAADASLIVVAATDTSVQTVITLLRHVAVNADCVRRLQEEISTVVDCGNTDVAALSELPYLDACVQEALRMMPPGPFGPPRTTGLTGVHICGTWVPPRTTVHVPVYAMHRDPAFFGVHADKYIPERWLEDERKLNSELEPFDTTAFMPFSNGYGSCVGKQLAVQNIKILIASILRSFDIRPADGFNETAFDASYQEYGLWTHAPLKLMMAPRQKE